MANTTDLYILRLEQDKYYIGKSGNVEYRIEAHKAGKGSSWTKKYKYLETLDIFKNVDDYEEDKQVKIYMGKYGIDNVRGGSYVQLILPQEQREMLQREIWSAQNRCVNCGEEGHFILQCKKPRKELAPVEPEYVSLAPAANTITITIPKPVMAAKAWFSATFAKVKNEVTNPESDLRSGKLFKINRIL